MGYLTTIVSALFFITIVLIAIVILLEKRNPAKSIAWLLVLTYLPIIGFVLYILFGSNWRKKKWINDNEIEDFKKIEDEIKECYQDHLTNDLLTQMPEHPIVDRLTTLGVNTCQSMVWLNRETRIFFDGVKLYNAIFSEIAKAKHHIHIVFFIIRNDEIGEKLKELLIEKAKSGCEVRLLYDHIGSNGIERNYVKQLSQGGVKVNSFSPPMFPIISRRLNYRNHRKIVIVDGQTAFTGGFNLGKEYVGGNKRLGYWRDTHIKISGATVYNLQLIFIKDWFYATKEKVIDSCYFPQIPLNMKDKRAYPVQIISSGPDQRWPAILQTYFGMIANAQKKVWLTTPYLIPDESILQALKTAALSGVDVRIILPGNPDHYSIYFATHSYIEELLEAGVKIYLYQKGFIHSKMLVCDAHVLSVGTANFNMRSSHIDFEVNALIYNRHIIHQALQQLRTDMVNSVQLDYDTYRQKPWYRNFIESIARLFSPII